MDVIELKALWNAAELMAAGGKDCLAAAMKEAGVSTAFDLEVKLARLNTVLGQVGSKMHPHLAEAAEGMSRAVVNSARNLVPRVAASVRNVATVIPKPPTLLARLAAGVETATAGISAPALLAALVTIGGVYLVANWGRPDSEAVRPITEWERFEGTRRDLPTTGEGYVLVQIQNHARRALAVVPTKSFRDHQSGSAPLYLCNFLHGGRCADDVVPTPNGPVRGENVPAHLTKLGGYGNSQDAWDALCSRVSEVTPTPFADGFLGRVGGDWVTIDGRFQPELGAPCSS